MAVKGHELTCGDTVFWVRHGVVMRGRVLGCGLKEVAVTTTGVPVVWVPFGDVYLEPPPNHPQRHPDAPA